MRTIDGDALDDFLASAEIEATNKQRYVLAGALNTIREKLRNFPSAQPEITDEQAIEHLQETGWMQNHDKQMYEMGLREQLADDSDSYDALLPSAQPEQRYTEEELRTFKHGISLSLLSKRSAQRWSYDEDTATDIEFLERLYEKVDADMRGEQDEMC